MTGQVQQRNDLNIQLICRGDDLVHFRLGQVARIAAAVLRFVASFDLGNDRLMRISRAVGGEGHIIQQEAQTVVAESKLELVIAIVLHLIEQGDNPALAEVLSAAVQMYNLIERVVGRIGHRILFLRRLLLRLGSVV